jgi:hypothetical protein
MKMLAAQLDMDGHHICTCCRRDHFYKLLLELNQCSFATNCDQYNAQLVQMALLLVCTQSWIGVQAVDQTPQSPCLMDPLGMVQLPYWGTCNFLCSL